MEPTELKDWDDLARLLRIFKVGEWIFRGVTLSTHKLIPKAGRAIRFELLVRPLSPVTKISIARVLKLRKAEKESFRQFRRAARPHLQFAPKTELEWLAVAQHHGLPTRLLDWTESLLIAAYFAVRGPPVWEPVDVDNDDPSMMELGALDSRPRKKKPAAIYALPAPPEFSEDDDLDPFSIHEGADPVLYYPPHLSPRVTVQKAVLTLHSAPEMEWQPKDLMKFEIPGGKFDEIKSALNLAGINEATLFPDLDGIGRHLGRLHGLE